MPRRNPCPQRIVQLRPLACLLDYQLAHLPKNHCLDSQYRSQNEFPDSTPRIRDAAMLNSSPLSSFCNIKVILPLILSVLVAAFAVVCML